MQSILHLVVSHPYPGLFASGPLERAGAPLFFSPVLVAAAALAPTGEMRFDLAL